GGAASSRDEAGFRVGEITELLLSARLGLTPSVQPQNREGREWSKGLLFVDAAPSRVVRRFLSGQAKLRGLPPKGERTVPELVALLSGSGAPEAAWAYMRAFELPDSKLRDLGPYLDSRAM